jgi:hypothetical protein
MATRPGYALCDKEVRGPIKPSSRFRHLEERHGNRPAAEALDDRGARALLSPVADQDVRLDPLHERLLRRLLLDPEPPAVPADDDSQDLRGRVDPLLARGPLPLRLALGLCPAGARAPRHAPRARQLRPRGGRPERHRLRGVSPLAHHRAEARGGRRFGPVAPLPEGGRRLRQRVPLAPRGLRRVHGALVWPAAPGPGCRPRRAGAQLGVVRRDRVLDRGDPPACRPGRAGGRGSWRRRRLGPHEGHGPPAALRPGRRLRPPGRRPSAS